MKKSAMIAALFLAGVLFGGCGDQSKIQNTADTTAVSEENVSYISDSTGMEQEDSADNNSATRTNQNVSELSDGTYTALFTTDSSMFRVSEACDGRGTLTVKNGEMTIHISLGSKKILNLYPGLAKDAAQDGAALLQPTEDTVTYSDGMTEEVYGFDVPVPALDTEFDLALIGTKGKWYDHKVSVSNPQLIEDSDHGKEIGGLEDGTYIMEITFEGGSGKAKILSPVKVVVTDNQAVAFVQGTSPNYDYMLVDGDTFLPVNTAGDSAFEIPVTKFDEPMEVIGDTVAMSKPHEIEYQITFHSDTAVQQDNSDSIPVESDSDIDSISKQMFDADFEISDPMLVYERSLELEYAQNFTVDYYKGGYILLTTTMDDMKFLVVPEGKELPENLNETLNKEIKVLHRPIKDIYLVASSAMDMFSALGGLDAITFSGQKEDGWYIESAKEAMARGDILYAGKYNKPDYELIASGHCALAIENMMISHVPEVMEKLESFGIPVIIEYSSYESHPLGRVEWIKFYGALLGKEAQAEEIFAEQTAIFNRVSTSEMTDKTVAFFYVTSNGLIQVRQSSDYIPKMIELVGGKYVFENLGDPQSKRSTMNMQVEEFYAGAKDADFLIYNSSIDGGVSSVEELLNKCELLADFKAVQNGDVWCTTNDVYQQSLSIGYLMEDIHAMLQGENEQMHYLFHLDHSDNVKS